MKPKFLIDCDGVCAWFTKPVLGHINYLLHTEFTDHHITEWDTYKALGIPEAIGKITDDFIKTKGFCANLEMYDDVREGIDALRKFADIRMVTAPFDSDYWQREREQWIVKHLGIDRHHIHQTHSKEDVVGTVLVDDKTSTLVKWQAAHPDGMAVLYRQPWNVADAWSGVVANNWPQLVAILRWGYAS